MHQDDGGGGQLEHALDRLARIDRLMVDGDLHAITRAREVTASRASVQSTDAPCLKIRQLLENASGKLGNRCSVQLSYGTMLWFQ